MTYHRLKPADRKAEILEAAIALATKRGVRRLTREEIAEAAGVTPGLITIRFKTIAALRKEIIIQGVKREILPIIAEGLLDREPAAMKADPALRFRAMASVAA